MLRLAPRNCATPGPASPATRASAAALERLEKSKVVAAIVELMQRTCVRVGNDCYAEANGSYGLTTLKDGHARISGHELRFRFKGREERARACVGAAW
jgi:DNA topoisomerase-1